MRIPVIHGLIERRVLVNYRVRPQSAARLLPPPFRPRLVDGWGIAGICLIRLTSIRPRWLSWPVGLSSENAAYRIAVEWTDEGQIRQGVYIWRRYTSSRLNSWAGGRIFPGIHRRADFAVRESDGVFDIRLSTVAGGPELQVVGRRSESLAGGSVFGELRDASDFFESGSLGYSPSRDGVRLQGLKLRCRNWHVEPLIIEQSRSRFFDDPVFFGPDAVAFDSALLMRGIEHEWHPAPVPRTDDPFPLMKAHPGISAVPEPLIPSPR